MVAHLCFLPNLPSITEYRKTNFNPRFWFYSPIFSLSLILRKGTLVAFLPLLLQHLCTHQLCGICNLGNVHLVVLEQLFAPSYFVLFLTFLHGNVTIKQRLNIPKKSEKETFLVNLEHCEYG